MSIRLNTRLPPLVATKTIYLIDVTISTNSYPVPVRSVVVRLCRTNKEVGLMKRVTRHENGPPANRRHSLAVLSAMVVVVLAGILAAIVVGAGRVMGLVVTYLVPVAVILGVVVLVFVLVRRGGGKDYDDGNAYDEWYHRF